MKKILMSTVIVLSVVLAMVLIGSILNGISWSSDFNGASFADALTSIGYIVAMLSGVVLTGLGVAYAVKTDCNKDCKNDKDEEKKK